MKNLTRYEDLPPIGEICESYPYWHTCVAICDYKDGRVFHDLHTEEFFFAKTGDGKAFRRVLSEQDTLINRLAEAFEKVDLNKAGSMREAIEDLVNDGWCQVKMQTESQFVLHHGDFFDGVNSAVRAYQRGFRLVDLQKNKK